MSTYYYFFSHTIVADIVKKLITTNNANIIMLQIEISYITKIIKYNSKNYKREIIKDKDIKIISKTVNHRN